MSTCDNEHDWPGGDYIGMTCCICGERFSGPHNAGKCYLHKDDPTPKSEEWQPTPGMVIAIGQPAISQEIERRKSDEQKRIAELEAELATLRRRVEFFGVPEKMCLLCGKEGPCDLTCPDSEVPVCMFDKTYPELIAITHAAEAEARKGRERFDFIHSHVEEIVDTGGGWYVYLTGKAAGYSGSTAREADAVRTLWRAGRDV